MKIDVSTDIQQALDKLTEITSAVKEKAVVRSLNEMADQAKVRASREIRAAGYNLKAARVKKAIQIIRASAGNLAAIVRASGRPMPLIEYDGKEGLKGRVTVKVKGARKAVADAFIATMPTGHRGIFRRKGSRHKRVVKNGRVTTQDNMLQDISDKLTAHLAVEASVKPSVDELIKVLNGIKFLRASVLIVAPVCAIGWQAIVWIKDHIKW